MNKVKSTVAMVFSICALMFAGTASANNWYGQDDYKRVIVKAAVATAVNQITVPSYTNYNVKRVKNRRFNNNRSVKRVVVKRTPNNRVIKRTIVKKPNARFVSKQRFVRQAYRNRW